MIHQGGTAERQIRALIEAWADGQVWRAQNTPVRASDDSVQQWSCLQQR